MTIEGVEKTVPSFRAGLWDGYKMYRYATILPNSFEACLAIELAPDRSMSWGKFQSVYNMLN